MVPDRMKSGEELPDHYRHVARDVVEMCNPRDGIWVDLGSGDGPVSRALTRISDSLFILVDPNPQALSRASERSLESGRCGRTLAVVARAEHLPFAEGSVDLVVSRGSVFFWDNRPAGIREADRVLAPGGKAMIGGGLGSTYPEWARQRFIERQRRGQRKRGPEAFRKFRHDRSPETFRRWAEQAGLREFRVVGEGGLPATDPDTGLGIWLLFGK